MVIYIISSVCVVDLKHGTRRQVVLSLELRTVLPLNTCIRMAPWPCTANKAVLRVESAAQLSEMAAVLKALPSLKVFIVGHTDNRGELQANTLLSQKRADAVVAALSSEHGIAPARLIARGVANLAPVSSNDAEEGRAKNRRVEMVVR